MANPITPRLLNPPGEEDFARLRDRLAETGYHTRGILDRIGSIELPARRARNLPRLKHLSSGDTPLDIFVRLFMLGVPVTKAEAGRAFGPASIEPWIRAGLVELHGESVLAPVRMTPFEHLLLVFDPPDAVERGAAADLVMGMTRNSHILLHSTIRRKVRHAVDMGTGCGVQAFLAATHSERVWALDYNPRSVNYAAFNACLNGLDNIECLQGDGFAPVRGRTFDLVVANPPFMVSPGRRYQHRDSGISGDGFCRRVVSEAPSLLNEGGFCQVILEWIHLKGRDYKERLAEWFEGTGCDGWVIRKDTEDPVRYADNWIRETERDDQELAAQLLRELVEYYERESIEAVSCGIIAMRRSTGRSNWLRFDDVPDLKLAPFGESIALGFELRDFLNAHRRNEDLMSQRLRTSPDLRMERICVADGRRWSVSHAQLRLAKGLEFKGNIDATVAGLVARCDGTRPLGELIRELAEDHRTAVEKVAAPALGVIRPLIERGFLLPAGSTTEEA